MKNNRLHIIGALFLTLFFVQCEDVLDKTDLGNITSDIVWDDPDLAEANLNGLYAQSTPGWQWGASHQSDNAPGSFDFLYGRIPDNSNDIYTGNFSTIREINVFLEGIENGSIAEDVRNPMIGQALVIRALQYWELVTTYGGVPILTESLTPDSDGLNRTRNTSTECVAQIVSDLDRAATLLPDVFAGSDFGRFTSGAALAIKGRILLHFASEHFDPDQTKNRWQDAYNALTEAKAALDAVGKGLHPSYADLWFDDSAGNPEIIWGRLYNANQAHPRDAFVRTFRPGLGGGRVDNPTIGLVDSYPMLDGKRITDNTSTYTYDPVLPWRNRDPRFAASIVWNGAVYPIEEPAPFKTSELYWSFQNNPAQFEADNAVTFTSFQTRKAIDPVLTHEEAQVSTTQWIEMRYAEVLLNLAEAANEIGNGSEALNILYDIRERAGIDNADGRYGLDAGLESDADAMRDAILNEKRIEFAFENKRPTDLLRRRMFGGLNGTQRMGYFITTTAAFDALNPSDDLLDDRVALEIGVLGGTIDLNDPAVYQTYFTTEIYSVEENSTVPGEVGTPIAFDDRYYFFDIPEGILNRNPQLTQTNGWPGGTFDPTE